MKYIGHKFFQKPVANKDFIEARSAMPLAMKKAIMTQEGMRRCLNTSPELFDGLKNELMTDFNERMFAAGYNEEMRGDILKSVLEKYYKLKERVESGERGWYRSKNERINKPKKKVTKFNWFKRGKVQFEGVI